MDERMSPRTQSSHRNGTGGAVRCRDRAELQHLYLAPQWLGFSLQGVNMQRINVQYFYRLATILRPLSNVAAGQTVEDAFPDLYNAETELILFLWNTIMPPEACFQRHSQKQGKQRKSKVALAAMLRWKRRFLVREAVKN